MAKPGCPVNQGATPDAERASSSFVDAADARLTIDRFRREVLPAKWHRTFELRFLQQLDQHEVGAQSGLSRTTVAYQEYRIRALLRRHLLERKAFQSGVFSHELRSGLYGAADADGDGKVSYREIAAFIERANASIPNERFRPELFARAPRSGEVVDLRGALDRRIDIDGTMHGHYILDDARGVRVADFHNAPGGAVHLVRPPGTLYLHREGDDSEVVVKGGDAVVAAAQLAPVPARTVGRGAAHDAFQTLFALPFDGNAVAAYRFPPPPPPPLPPPRRIAGLALFGLAAVATATGIGLAADARRLRGSVGPATSQQEVARVNGRVAGEDPASTAMFALAGASAISGLLLFVLPTHNGVDFGLGGRF